MSCDSTVEVSVPFFKGHNVLVLKSLNFFEV